MKRSKKSLTLLEVLIALVFLGFIFSFLMTTFSTTIKTSLKLNQIKSEAFSRFHVHRRLFLLFSHLGSLTKNEESFYFYTEKQPGKESPTLYFRIKGILDPDPEFSCINHCALQLQDNKLLLTFFSENNPSFIRQETLMNDV